MSFSTAPTVKAAIRTRLAADSNLTNVQITHGSPYPKRPEGELVLIGRAVAGDPFGTFGAGQSPHALGQTSREERYTIDLVVSVLSSARDDYATLEARAYQIAGYIDTNLRAWQASAFDGVARWVIPTGSEDREGLDNDNREASVTMTLSVAARI